MINPCDQHDFCQLQCAECRSYECHDQGYHRELPWLHRRDWMAIAQSRGLSPTLFDDAMPLEGFDDWDEHYNDRAERMP